MTEKRPVLSLTSIVYIIFSLALTSPLHAEISQLHIEGAPQRLTEDIIAERDNDGNICAAIQVTSELEGFSYESNNGVVYVDDRPGQDMVYLQAGERVLEIYHTGFEKLMIVLSEVGIRLQPRGVWQIRISGEKENNARLYISTEPSGAEIYENGTLIGNTNDRFFSEFREGEHTFTLIKTGYRKHEVKVDLPLFLPREDNAIRRLVTLVPLENNLILRTIPAGAEVFLEGRSKGTTPYQSGIISKGMVEIRLMKEKYYPLHFSVDIQMGIQLDTVLTLQPITGSLIVETEPAGAVMLLNGDEIGRSSLNRNDIQVGIYSLTIRKLGWLTVRRTITINENKTTSINETLENELNVFLETEPGGVELFQGSHSLGKTPLTIRLPLGINRLQLIKPEYQNATWEVNILEETKRYNYQMTELSQPISISTQPSSAEVYIDGDNMVFTPYNGRLRVGHHKLEIKKDGYRTRKVNIEIDNEENRFFFELEKKFDWEKLASSTFFWPEDVQSTVGGGFGVAGMTLKGSNYERLFRNSDESFAPIGFTAQLNIIVTSFMFMIETGAVWSGEVALEDMNPAVTMSWQDQPDSTKFSAWSTNFLVNIHPAFLRWSDRVILSYGLGVNYTHFVLTDISLMNSYSLIHRVWVLLDLEDDGRLAGWTLFWDWPFSINQKPVNQAPNIYRFGLGITL